MAYKRGHVKGKFRLKPGKLLYSAGLLRLMECVRFRIKDVEFENHHIIVRDGKGGKDRATVLGLDLNYQEEVQYSHNILIVA